MPASQLYGSLTRKLYDIWRQASVLSVAGGIGPDANAADLSHSTTSPSTNDQHRYMVTEIQHLFHSIEIYPTESQVYEMIQCASRCSLSRNSVPNTNVPSGTSNENSNNKEGLTFGEFCFFASVLINSYRQNIPPPKPLSQSDAFFRKLERIEQTIPDTSSHSDTNFEVFLGGSCNPTRWRTDIVIPELKQLGITYYNPQVEHWGPELIELESYAKQNSEILFFVVDNQTRAIASMIEVAFIASTQRKLILVINDLPGPKCKIVNDELSVEEYENLIKGRAFLRDVVERQGIPIFTQIPVALKSAVRVLRDNIWPQDLTPPEDDIIPVKMGHISLGDKMIHMFKVFESLKNGNNQFTFAELALAYRALTSRDLSRELIKQLARLHLDNDSKNSSPSLSRSSSSDEPEEEHFEVVAPATPTASTTKKPKSRSKKSRKMKKIQDIFTESLSESSADLLPPLEDIVIDFDQFCCIMSELNEKARQLAENVTAKRGQPNGVDNEQMLARTILQFPGKVLEKVGSIFNVFSIIKTMLSIPVDECSSNTGKVNPGSVNGSSDHHYLHHASSSPQVQNSQSQRNPHLSHSFPSRSGSPLVTSASGSPWNHALESSHSSHHHSPSPLLPSNLLDASHASSYGGGVSPGVNQNSYPQHFRQQHSHYPARSVSPNMFRYRHSYSSPSVNDHHGHRLGSHHLSGHLHSGHYHPHHHQSSHSVRESTLSPLRRGLHGSSTSSITSLLYDNYTDLYIGGSLEESFLNQNIIPLLKKYSITYSTLKADRWTSQRMIPLEAKNIEKSRVLLFLITKDSLDISFMIMAAHYVGLGYNVVLCIQNIDSGSPFVISGGKTETWLSTDAIKDYNRGRSYLSDLATKVGVPVFSDINESIQCCIEKILSFE